ncbi:WecB/TagA/CpsF family glycosyltransferase [Iningainema tapete]
MEQIQEPTAVSNNLHMQVRYSKVDASNSNRGKKLTRIPNLHQVQKLPNLDVYLLERRITCMTVPAIVEAIYKASIEGRKITVANYNVHSFNLSMQLPWYYQFLQSAEITHCDSVGMLKAISWMGLKLPRDYQSSYTMLMPKVLEKCNEQRLSVFLLGAKPNCLETALNRLREEYPRVNFFGYHGYFDKEDTQQNEAVIEKINQAKPHVLIVGMGMPVQENWIRRYGDHLHVNAIMLGGAIIDRLAGVVPDCPRFVSHMGLEWLYRLYREPKRLAARYLLGNPAFVLHIALAKFYASPLRVQAMQSIDSNRLEADANKNKHLNSTNQNQESLANIYTRVKQIADYFVEANLLTKTQVETALSEQKLTGMLLGEVLERKGAIQQQTIDKIVKNMSADVANN